MTILRKILKVTIAPWSINTSKCTLNPTILFRHRSYSQIWISSFSDKWGSPRHRLLRAEREIVHCLPFVFLVWPTRFFTPPAPQKAWTPHNLSTRHHAFCAFNFPNLPTLKKENLRTNKEAHMNYNRNLQYIYIYMK